MENTKCFRAPSNTCLGNDTCVVGETRGIVLGGHTVYAIMKIVSREVKPGLDSLLPLVHMVKAPKIACKKSNDLYNRSEGVLHIYVYFDKCTVLIQLS